MNSLALLPTRTNINPTSPEDAEYFDRDQVAYIMRRPGLTKTMVATSFGSLGDDFAVGTVHPVHHDQTRRDRGLWKIIGRVDFRTGTTEGEVPNRKIPHHVFK